MNHLAILPILLPLGAALVCMTLHASLRRQRQISLVAALLLVPLAVWLFASAADGDIVVYALGSWQAPFGIVLVLDRLSALMVGLTTALAVPALLYATATGTDERGLHFHALFQLQIAGINGAFLTGDLFNLFVFFEVLLLASYGLLVHGHGRRRAGAGLIYVILNLAGSVLFLVAVALLYGTLGTLNLADMAAVLPAVPVGDQALVRTAATLLLLVFALKAALLPLSFWLPHVYGAASAPVAALFAIMTKVGIYGILRVSTVAFPAAPFTADVLEPWLLPLAVATIVGGTVGAMAARRLGVIVANLVVVSTGMLLAAISAQTIDGTAAALYYLVSTTLVTGAFFLLTGQIASERGEAGDALVQGPPVRSPVLLGLAYLVLAVAISGMPPLSGFIGKLMVMQSLQTFEAVYALWLVILVSGLLVILVLARAASVFFWEPRAEGDTSTVRFGWPAGAVLLLVAASPVLTAAAAEVAAYARATATQIHSPAAYFDAVLPDPGDISRERRP
jgi:multicomponent K+:H+ antiporter subunit D